VKDLAMQVAAANPRCVTREQVAPETVEGERNIYRAQASGSGKPAAVVEKIVDGKMEKFFADTCLLEQPFIKDPQKTVGQMVTDAVAHLGENIVVRRFSRFQLGELTENPT
jgi:elongation factor Ts